MPSNKDIIKSIAELSPELDTDGKNNDELASILSGLKAEKKDPAVEEGPAFYVMPGKCLTSKRGLIADGDEIKAEDLAGGKEALNAFVKSGHVGKA